MGYYTKFSLRVLPKSMEPEVRATLEALSGYLRGPFIEDSPEGGYINDGEGPKWYSSHKHALEASRMFPDAKIFIAYVTEDDHAFVNEFHAATYRNELELLPGAARPVSLRPLQDPRELFELVAEIALADALTGDQKDEYPNIFNKNHNDFFPSEVTATTEVPQEYKKGRAVK